MSIFAAMTGFGMMGAGYVWTQNKVFERETSIEVATARMRAKVQGVAVEDTNMMPVS